MLNCAHAGAIALRNHKSASTHRSADTPGTSAAAAPAREMTTGTETERVSQDHVIGYGVGGADSSMLV